MNQGIDVMNMHAPSGGKKKGLPKDQLTDAQRQALLRTFLQTESQANACGQTIGVMGQGLLGGDINTTESVLSTLLMNLTKQKVLTTTHKADRPVFGHHGDLCIGFGLDARPIDARAQNHDPQHEQYGIVLHAMETTSSIAASPSVATTHAGSQPITAPARPNTTTAIPRPQHNAAVSPPQ